ncbi:hypothetical protein LWF01_02995 [Saxibacter everestensis]|uniref:Uncharacterized protein n=1 Tax=Saxibacter everestensis TaxID=2909229 RepID=A0ABY8QVC2_9MICO|nr:hypothetical protein LWF01_02995 [Brevibacteriaceae bacterium ZFBP1038]
MDLGELWRGRQWPALLEYIDGLPSASRTRQAQADDPDFARMVVDDEETKPSSGRWSPPLAEWDTTAIILSGLRTDIKSLLSTVAAMGGGKGKQEPVPSPRTAIDAERDVRHVQRSQALVDLFERN